MTSSTYITKYTAWLVICFFCTVFLVTLGATAQEINLRSDNSPKVCTVIAKPTNYVVKKGDHLAAILRTMGLEPVFGKNNSLAQLLKVNNIQNPDVIEPGQELTVPFACEEQASVWKTQDRGADRLMTREKESFVTVDNKAIKPGAQVELFTPEVVTVAPSVSDTPKVDNAVIVQNTTDQIIDKNKPIEELNRKNIDHLTDDTMEMSEALRYRMICDGEWNGTQCVTRYSILFATLSGWYNRYDGVDPSIPANNKGVLLSKLNPTGGIGWNNYWTESIKTELYATLQQSQLLPESREVPIEQNKKYLGSFRLGLRYESGSWGVGLGIRQFDKIFYRFRFSGLSQPCFSPDISFAGCGIFVHTASVMGMSADISYMLYQAGKFRYDLRADYFKLGTARTGGFEIQEGTGYSLGFRVTHDRVKEYIYGDVTYGISEQNTSIEIQTLTELGFTFGYAWKLRDW